MTLSLEPPLVETLWLQLIGFQRETSEMKGAPQCQETMAIQLTGRVSQNLMPLFQISAVTPLVNKKETNLLIVTPLQTKERRILLS
jgi:hypothetical protein